MQRGLGLHQLPDWNIATDLTTCHKTTGEMLQSQALEKGRNGEENVETKTLETAEPSSSSDPDYLIESYQE